MWLNLSVPEIGQIAECGHKFITDIDSQEEICIMCGIVQIPSYKKKEDQEIVLDVGIETQATQPTTEGFIVSRATAIDFSNGGFLATKIDQRNRDVVGKKVNTQHYNKVRYMNNYILSATGMGTYKHAIWQISQISDKLNLPYHVRERSCEVFKRNYNLKTNIHNSRNIVCACVYFACKEGRINRKMEDIAAIVLEEKSGISSKINSDIFTAYQKLIEDLKLTSPKNFGMYEEISYVSTRIGLSERVSRQAYDIYLEVRSKDRIYFAGKSAKITATSLLYIAAAMLEESRKFDEAGFGNIDVIKEVAGITPYILKKRVFEHLGHRHFRKYKEQVPIFMLQEILLLE